MSSKIFEGAWFTPCAAVAARDSRNSALRSCVHVRRFLGSRLDRAGRSAPRSGASEPPAPPSADAFAAAPSAAPSAARSLRGERSSRGDGRDGLGRSSSSSSSSDESTGCSILGVGFSASSSRGSVAVSPRPVCSLIAMETFLADSCARVRVSRSAVAVSRRASPRLTSALSASQRTASTNCGEGRFSTSFRVVMHRAWSATCRAFLADAFISASRSLNSRRRSDAAPAKCSAFSTSHASARSAGALAKTALSPSRCCPVSTT
mmetsp:Transcript_3325/g.14488  ORF Transcript_3325/g.14488 Transcript_3325/m.14488 type:complete len:263 (-) Transcript_3325:320-1108(-)